MNTQEDYNIPEFFYSLQRIEKEAFKFGEKKMLDKVLEIVRQWEKGKYSNEEFKKVLRDYQKEFYGK